MRGITYQRIKNYIEREGGSISGYLESLIDRDMNDKREPVPEVVEPRPRDLGVSTSLPRLAQGLEACPPAYFTF